MASSTPLKSNVLLVLFPGFNTLDMNGPYEVLQRSADASVFTITVASETEITTSVEGVQVKVSFSRVGSIGSRSDPLLVARRGFGRRPGGAVVGL